MAFDQVLKAVPDDEAAMEYSFKARLQLAESLFEQKECFGGTRRLPGLHSNLVDCGKCHQYIRESEDLYKEAHCRKGMQCYNQERLHEAIREWGRVRILDPDYRRVGSLIEKAQRIPARLEDLK